MGQNDSDSEDDRRAFGQYPSLNIEEGSDIDEEAAAYLRSVRAQRRKLPAVVTVPYVETLDHEAEDGEIRGDNPQDGACERSAKRQRVTPTVEIRGSNAWVRELMKDFLDVRLKLHSHELSEIGERGAEAVADHVAGLENVAAVNGSARAPDGTNDLLSLSGLLKLDSVSASRMFEQRVQELKPSPSLSPQSVYELYSLAAALESPLLPHLDAAMGELLRRCCQIRAETPKGSRTQHAYLDILSVIAGAYFGQDEGLRYRFRQHGIHI